MAKPALKYYRLWCGRKRYTHWLPDVRQIWDTAYRHGLAYHDNMVGGLGPLTWIELGERARPRSRTIVVGRLD